MTTTEPAPETSSQPDSQPASSSPGGAVAFSASLEEPRLTAETIPLAEALDRLEHRLQRPQILSLSQDNKTAITQAIQRVRAQWLGGPEASLTIAIAGGTGVGKSTLINALAGGTIASASPIRPTTMQIRVYHHQDLPQGNIPFEIGETASFVPHTRTELRRKVVVDTPDLDSLVHENRWATQALLKAAHLVIYVFSPDKYADERVWSVIRQEKPGTTTVAVLNQVDQARSLEEVNSVTQDIRQKFEMLGVPDVRVFRTMAKAHVVPSSPVMSSPVVSSPVMSSPVVSSSVVSSSGRDTQGNGKTDQRATDTAEDRDGFGEQASSVSDQNPCGVDETLQLRSMIEDELQNSDVMRLIRTKREAVSEHLREQIDRVAPAGLAGRLSSVDQQTQTSIAGLAERIATLLSGVLDSLEVELSSVATLQQHERFRGPLRTWLVISDFFRYGLAGLVNRLVGRSYLIDQSILQQIVKRGEGPEVDDLFRQTVGQVADALYDQGLPVDPWRRQADGFDGERLLRRVALRVQNLFDQRLSSNARRRPWVVWFGDTLGSLIPAGFVGLALYVLGRDLLAGQSAVQNQVLHLLLMLVFFFIALQSVVSVLLPGVRGLGRQTSQQAVREEVAGAFEDWLATYRRQLQSDLADLRAPLSRLERLSAASRGQHPPAQPEITQENPDV